MKLHTALIAWVTVLPIPIFAQTTLPSTQTSANVDSATPVTLHFKEAPPQEVYESLYEQAGAKLQTRRNIFSSQRNKNVTIDMSNVPFWTAMRELNKQTELAPSTFPGQNELTRQSMKGACTAAGPFIVIADDRFGRDRFDELTVYVEPKFAVQSHEMEPQIEAAIDEDGHPIKSRHVGWPKEDMPGNAFAIRPSLESDGDRRVAYLKGYVNAWVREKTQHIEIDNAMANNSDRTVDGHRFLFNVMQPVPSAYTLTLLTFDLPDGASVSNLQVQLIDDKGRPLAEGGSHGGSSDRGQLSLTLRFQQPPNVGAPSKIVLTFASELRKIKIPFEFGKAPDGHQP